MKSQIMNKLILAFIICLPLLINCSKDENPIASIYILTESRNPVPNVSVRFYAADDQPDSDETSLDTTIITNDKGIAQLELMNDAFLDVQVLIRHSDSSFSYYSSNAQFITNEHFIDSIIVSVK